MEHQISEHEEVKRTVVYSVLVVDSNSGAWYRECLEQEFECILDIVDKPFGGQEIFFRVLGRYHPVKYIKQQHCLIVKQHLASHKELMGFYGS